MKDARYGVPSPPITATQDNRSRIDRTVKNEICRPARSPVSRKCSRGTGMTWVVATSDSPRVSELPSCPLGNSNLVMTNEARTRSRPHGLGSMTGMTIRREVGRRPANSTDQENCVSWISRLILVCFKKKKSPWAQAAKSTRRYSAR